MIRVATFLFVLISIALPTAILGQNAPAAADAGPHAFVAPDAVKFEPFEVPGFASGLRLAVIHGDPTAASGDYTVRLAFPAGYTFPAHYHPKAEHATVLNGTLKIAMGTDENPGALQSYTPGAFLYFPANEPHYGGVEGETVIQLHGEAPFQVLLSNPSS